MWLLPSTMLRIWWLKRAVFLLVGHRMTWWVRLGRVCSFKTEPNVAWMRAKLLWTTRMCLLGRSILSSQIPFPISRSHSAKRGFVARILCVRRKVLVWKCGQRGLMRRQAAIWWALVLRNTIGRVWRQSPPKIKVLPPKGLVFLQTSWRNLSTNSRVKRWDEGASSRPLIPYDAGTVPNYGCWFAVGWNDRATVKVKVHGNAK